VLAPPRRAVEAAKARDPQRLEVLGRIARELGRDAGNNDADSSARPNEVGEVVEVRVIRPEVVIGVDADGNIEEAVCEREIMRLGMDWNDRSTPASLIRSQLSVAPIQRSVAHTWTPNSFAKKIELIALPQPMSSRRMPGVSRSRSDNDSMSHTAIGPIMLSIIQSMWYPA
jgi:hypothetical protein